MALKYQYLIAPNVKVTGAQTWFLVANETVFTKKDALKVCKQLRCNPRKSVKRRLVTYCEWEPVF